MEKDNDSVILTSPTVKDVYNELPEFDNPPDPQRVIEGLRDTGYDFNVFEGFVVVPIVGIVWQNAKVADVADTEFYVRGGGEGKYAFITDGIKYEYSLESFVGTNGNFSTGIKIGFWSVEDEGGVDLGINAFKDEFDWRYKFSLTGKILF